MYGLDVWQEDAQDEKKPKAQAGEQEVWGKKDAKDEAKPATIAAAAKSEAPQAQLDKFEMM